MSLLCFSGTLERQYLHGLLIIQWNRNLSIFHFTILAINNSYFYFLFFFKDV